jgi:hypothetical protein
MRTDERRMLHSALVVFEKRSSSAVNNRPPVP